MHYLIDGHNLIVHIPDIDLEDPNDEVKLILLLRSWTAAGRRRRVTVFFDGGLPGGRRPELSQGLVEVVFAPEGEPADNLIIRRVRKVKHPGGFTVVTGDVEIMTIARKRQVKVLTSEAFARQLEAEREQRRQAAELDRGSKPEVSPSEVAEWLELFGPEPEAPAPPPPRPSRERKRPKAEPEEKPRSPAELKTEGGLSEEEVDAWLAFFRSDSDDE